MLWTVVMLTCITLVTLFQLLFSIPLREYTTVTLCFCWWTFGFFATFPSCTECCCAWSCAYVVCLELRCGMAELVGTTSALPNVPDCPRVVYQLCLYAFSCIWYYPTGERLLIWQLWGNTCLVSLDTSSHCVAPWTRGPWLWSHCVRSSDLMPPWTHLLTLYERESRSLPDCYEDPVAMTYKVSFPLPCTLLK